MIASMNIHGAKSITYVRVQFSNFWAHRFTVHLEDGKDFEIDAFAREPLDLNALPDEQAHEMKNAPVEPAEVASA